MQTFLLILNIKFLVFFILTLIRFIPDVPHNIKVQIEKENFITQKAIWSLTKTTDFSKYRAKNRRSGVFDFLLKPTYSDKILDSAAIERLNQNLTISVDSLNVYSEKNSQKKFSL